MRKVIFCHFSIISQASRIRRLRFWPVKCVQVGRHFFRSVWVEVNGGRLWPLPICLFLEEEAKRSHRKGRWGTEFKLVGPEHRKTGRRPRLISVSEQSELSAATDLPSGQFHGCNQVIDGRNERDSALVVAASSRISCLTRCRSHWYSSSLWFVECQSAESLTSPLTPIGVISFCLLLWRHRWSFRLCGSDTRNSVPLRSGTR